MATRESSVLVAGLEIEAPASIAVGRGTAFMIAGHAYEPARRVRRLAVRVDDSLQPIRAFGLPRADLYERVAGSDPAAARAFHSGFAALVDLAPRERAARLTIELVAELDRGGTERLAVGAVDAEPRLTPPDDVTAPAFPSAEGPRVAICMATYEPPGELLERQLSSIREQTHGNWICLISDDASSEQSLRRLTELTEGDPRFVVSRGPERLGFYRNFERAMSMAPAAADFVTLCDQDDRWHPRKLERLLDGIGDAELAYSDARVVSPEGELISPSYWTERRNNYTNFASLLLANSVTGAASLFRRDLLDDALPLPPRIARGFHDHWLAVVALARGEIRYLDEPLYDYVQHTEAVIGHSRANKRPKAIRQHLIERLRRPTGGSRAVYYYDWHQLLLFAEVLKLRCWKRMTPAKRRTVKRVLGADHHISGLAWLLGRRARRLWGHDETLDRELFYSYALARRRLVSLWNAGRSRPGRLLPRDVSIPDAPNRDH